MDKKSFSLICAIVTSVLWGSAFVAQDMGMDFIGPHTFNVGRFLIGFFLLITFVSELIGFFSDGFVFAETEMILFSLTLIDLSFTGKFLARGGKSRTNEGIDSPRVVVVEFPDYETAKVCYDSKEYQEAHSILEGHVVRHHQIVEGY